MERWRKKVTNNNNIYLFLITTQQTKPKVIYIYNSNA